MPGTYLGYPFDEEIFYMTWQSMPDPIKLAMLNSGAIVEDATIRRLISSGSNFFTMPIYNVLGGTPDNYDGKTDIKMSEPDATHQSGVVYGRAHSWKDRDFIHDFNSGADPMRQIAGGVARFWQKQRQKLILQMLSGLFKVTTATGDDDAAKVAAWKEHIYDISIASAVGPDNCMGPTTMGDAIQKALGDNGDIISLCWMHSRVAQNLAGLELLEFRKYTDAQGIQRQLKVADFNGVTVIVDDDCPSEDAGSGVKKYHTYALGRGAISHAPAPVKTPVELGRSPLEAGGYDYFVTRFRECYHPNGFSYKLPSGVISPTDEQLSAEANWEIVAPPKTIPLVDIVTNG
ncbi:MAG: coat protein [Ruminococcus flavefaciens]|nr:coat protein [Ruminococcus flavefaciens]